MIQEAIHNSLMNDPTIAGLIEGVYPMKVPASKLNLNKNFITYFQVSGAPDHQIGYKKEVFQINILSKNYSTAQTITQEVCRVLQFFIGNLGNKQLVERSVQISGFDDLDEKTGYYLKIVEFKFVYK